MLSMYFSPLAAVALVALSLATPNCGAAERKSGTLTRSASGAALSIASVEDRSITPQLSRGARGAAVVQAQILLDHAWFSPGEISGAFDENMQKAVRAFQEVNGIAVSGRVDQNTWRALRSSNAPVLMSYAVTDKDTMGPFVRIPSDMMERAQLPYLGYETPLEGIAEKFHASPRLLRQMNPGKAVETGVTLMVPNVASETHPAKVATIILFKADRRLQAVNR